MSFSIWVILLKEIFATSWFVVSKLFIVEKKTTVDWIDGLQFRETQCLVGQAGQTKRLIRLHSEKNGSSNKIVWLTIFDWFHKTFWLSRPNFCPVNQTRLLKSTKVFAWIVFWLYQIFYWLNQMFWLNISNNFERAFWGYKTHHELRQ